MINKNIIMITIIILSLFFVSAVSAAENATDDIALMQTDENQILSENEVGNFTELNQAIENSENELVLTKNYTYISDDGGLNRGITINKENFIIDGQGYTIDGAKKARIFNLNANNITFKNINFINAYLRSDGGSAIFAQSNTCSVVNCNFTNNYAGYRGGAIYSYSDVNIVNSKFTDNTGLGAHEGGAVYSNRATIENCDFTGNAAGYGGAIYSNHCFIENSSFTNNLATTDYGGAINCPECTIIGCNFTDNNGDIGGGIYSTSLGYVLNCIFNGNIADNKGGALYQLGQGRVINCSFMNNYALDGYGGAIAWDRCSFGEFSNCIFINNTASTNGGAVGWDTSDNGYIFNCSFINNTATLNGGSIYLVKANDVLVSACSFVNNSMQTGQGIIFYNNKESSSNLTVNNNIFLNNEVCEIIFYQTDDACNVDFNWFGNNATNASKEPQLTNATANAWLFLNGTATPNVIPISGKSEVIFKLYAYNRTSGIVSEYDNTLLIPLNLTLTSANGKTNAETVKPGDLVEYTATATGTGSVTATIENATYTIEFKIKYDPNIVVGSLETYYSENIALTLDYNSTATGKVNITLKGKEYNMTFTDVDLNKTITLVNVLPDEYNVTVGYSGDNNFINVTANGTLTVNKLDTNVSCDSIITVYNSDDYMIITLNDINGKPVNDVSLAVDFNGSIDNYTTENGTVKIPVKGLVTGNYTAMITFNETSIYLGSNATANVTVLKASAELSSDGLTTVYQVHEYLNVALKDADGNPITNDYVNITINGVTYNCKLDENGNVELIIRLNPKTYKATITFENGNYNKTTITTKVVVKKATPKLTAKKKTFKKSLKIKKYAVTLKDNTGKAMKNVRLTLKIKGKTYAAKTNSKGKATFKIKKLTKKGTFTAKVTFKGNNFYVKVNKNVKIKIK